MLKITQLNFGFSDAENYRRRENKALFNSIFLRDDSLERLIQNNIFFSSVKKVQEKRLTRFIYQIIITKTI
jgi:hypothetical protein